MGEVITLQKLLELQKQVWSFRFRNRELSGEAMLREQIKSIEQISRVGSMVAAPIALYLLVRIALTGNAMMIAGAVLAAVLGGFIMVRNFLRTSIADAPIDELHRFVSTIHIECVVNAFIYGGLVAIPVGMGAVPASLDMVSVAFGTIIVGGFIYGSIPRAQGLFLGSATILMAFGFLAAGVPGAVPGTVLFVFFALCTDYIYRLFFFNFAKRHLNAQKLKANAETVRLLLNDYAEQGSDWLWQFDSEGRIADASPRFLSAIGHDGLDGMVFVDLFDASTGRNALCEAIRSRAPFRDLVLPLCGDNSGGWWKVAGRPTEAKDGVPGGFRGVATDVTAAKRAEDKVAHLAHFDSLTDLPNRALFHESLQRSILRMRDGQQLAVLYLDLDNFKLINDTLGHGAGDAVLRAIANRLEHAIGIEDVVCRLGGDEFAISLRNIASPESARQIAESILATVGEPVMIEGQPVSTDISIGMALCPEHGNSAEDLLCQADIALYDAKKGGRGQVALFTPGMRAEVEDRRDIELDLRNAIHNDELELHYQPLVNIETGETVAYEALLRWTHPRKGMIPPDQFIPVAEESGLIVALGEWVIRTALREIRNWPEHLSVSVNLSPVQMRSPNLTPTIVNALAATGVAPHRLELEITESVLMSGNQSNVDLLHRIRSLGVRIALDDFGTGYSSLNYLRSFPFDKIKIDRCFVEDVESREDCRAIIRAVTGLASSLGMVTTAEGVERDDQLALLKQEGCQQVQGYLFSRAVPASAVEGRVECHEAQNQEGIAELRSGEDEQSPFHDQDEKRRRA